MGKIDKEFQSICPAHTPEESSRLENSLATEGQLHPILTWRGLIIDGYQRLEKLTSLGIEPKFAEHPGGLDCREDVIEWIINHQLGRRNLTEEQKRWLRGNRYLAEKNRPGGQIDNKNAAKKRSAHGEQVVSATNPLAEKLGNEYGVSQASVRRDATFVEHVREIDKKVPGAKEKILSGKTRLERKQVKELADKPAKEIERVLSQPAEAKEELGRLRKKKEEGESEAEFWVSQVDVFCNRVQWLIGKVPEAPWMDELKLNRVRDSLRSAIKMLESMKEPANV